MLYKTAYFIAFAVLCACSGSGDRAAIVPVAENGVKTVNLPQGGGYTYAATISDTNLAETEAQITPGLAIVAPPTTGTAVFTGQFNMDIVTDIVGAEGNAASVSGPLTLDVDFANGTITSRDSDLTVAGSYTGHDLTGTVTYDGLEGVMAGAVGAERAIGVFTRESADSIYAGGFYTDDAP